MSFYSSRFQPLQFLKDGFTPILSVVVASGLVCIAAGSVRASRNLNQLQNDVVQSAYVKQLVDKIMNGREMLSVSVRTAAVVEDLDWKGRYDAYENETMKAIVQIEDTGAAVIAISEIEKTLLEMASIEHQAFSLVQQNNAQKALTLLSSESYRANQDVSIAKLQTWSKSLSQQIQSKTGRQDKEWLVINILIGIGIVLLTVAWGVLLARIGYYSLQRQSAWQDSHQTQQKMAAHSKEVQSFKAKLLKKHAVLEDTLGELQQTKDQLAVSHQDVQVSKAALSQKAATLETIVDELQITKFKLANSHRELQVSKAALLQKATTLENLLEELQHTQVQMVQSEKMSSLGHLVAGIAHEINNPINFIHANLDPVQDYVNDLLGLVADYQQHYPQPAPSLRSRIEAVDLDFVQTDFPKVLNSMAIGTERIQQIVLSLRNFSRSDESGIKLANIHDGLESALLILQHRLNARGGCLPIEVTCEYGDIPLVECYPGLINQVFMNLFSNAIDALDEQCEQRGDDVRGTITVRTSVVEKEGVQWVEIAIADTGIGIPEDIQGRVFNAFFTTKPVGKGTGMGLSISHTIVTKKHSGQLTFFSTAGEGAEFVVQLPVAVEAVAIEEPSFTLQPPMTSASVRGQAAQFVL